MNLSSYFSKKIKQICNIVQYISAIFITVKSEIRAIKKY